MSRAEVMLIEHTKFCQNLNVVMWNGPVKFGAILSLASLAIFRHYYRGRIPMVNTVYYCNMHVRERAAEVMLIEHTKLCPNLHEVM